MDTHLWKGIEKELKKSESMDTHLILMNFTRNC